MVSLPLTVRNPVLPLDLLLSAIPSLPRALLDRLVERAIDRMDEIDGDNDIELNGDEQDETNTEDAFVNPYGLSRGGIYAMPGCPVSDPDDTLDPYH